MSPALSDSPAYKYGGTVPCEIMAPHCRESHPGAGGPALREMRSHASEGGPVSAGTPGPAGGGGPLVERTQIWEEKDALPFNGN